MIKKPAEAHIKAPSQQNLPDAHLGQKGCDQPMGGEEKYDAGENGDRQRRQRLAVQRQQHQRKSETLEEMGTHFTCKFMKK